jgi:hypothetical protein
MANVSASGAAFVLAASQGGTPVWLLPLIGAGSAVLAAFLTAAASAYAARRRAQELELSNSFELAKQYLESARNYTQAIYLPLAIAVYKLHSKYLTFKAANSEVAMEEAETEEVPSPETEFIKECTAFILTTDNLFQSGAAAVLTLRLDESLTLFVSFLRESLTASRIVKSAFLKQTLTNLSLNIISFSVPLVGAIASPIAASLIEVGGIQSRSNRTIIAAPVSSGDFEKQFVLYVDTIKASIKEVTLGGYKQK